MTALERSLQGRHAVKRRSTETGTDDRQAVRRRHFDQPFVIGHECLKRRGHLKGGGEMGRIE
ncbi:hypothetical protein [Glycomyces tenuis]|uniref:hypothetical protein n=1 Tax=Glycomyces tenuis TaxID=58116 RepID=UPI000418DE97|nr:hypothetical protein [Glycomyces tenuis]